MIFVSVVRDYDMYDKCVGQNKFCRNVQLNPIDNRVENKGISQRYNEFWMIMNIQGKLGLFLS